MQYIDLTPKWQEILPVWQRIVEDATRTLKPHQLQRFWAEMRRMAEAADRWGAYCAAVDEAAGAAEMERINEGLIGPLPTEERP